MKLKWFVILVATLAFAAASVQAQESTDADTQPTPDEDVVETIEVKHAKQKGPKHKSLQFLKDNRMFLRAQLDRLSMQITRERAGDAEMLDARYLMLKEMSAAIAAARDTVQSTFDSTATQGLLTSVSELAGIEAELAYMELLLNEQRERLLMLEQDFLGHQETALVIVVRGLTGKNAPESIVLQEDEDVLTVALTPAQRLSLEQGGVAQIYHEFVEPRDHELSVRFAGAAWQQMQPVTVALEAPRDRITFLELDLSQLDTASNTAGLLTNIWYR